MINKFIIYLGFKKNLTKNGDVKNKVLCIKGVDEVDVQLVWDPPWGSDMMSDGAKLELGMM